MQARYHITSNATGVWDGKTVDVSWYLGHESADSYDIDTAAQLAGVSALVNGLVNEACVVWTSSTQSMTAAQWNDVNGQYVTQAGDTSTGGSNNSTDTYHYGIENFDGKTVRLTADIDMGATFAYGGWTGPNYMPIGGQYLMTPNDTTTRIDASFCGTFDGDGHYVLNIYCNRHSSGNYGDGSSVGLIGRLGVHDSDPDSLRPATPGVYDVGITGYILANRSVGGIVGKIGRTTGTATISGCVNYASVNNTDAKGLGGIVGAGWNKGKIVDCYNMGDITSTYANPTGGISGSNEIPIENCYNAGKISAATDTYAMAIGTDNGGAPYSVITNCYYVRDSAPGGGYYSGQNYTDGVFTQSIKGSSDYSARLGSAYVSDEGNMNGGYPILAWQDRAAAVANSIAEEAT
ncbi:MAG: hypothetical protein LUG13_06675 [Oscillospiraceae bacterium]|nr:hypothetical protein [Oscillospiraceae bacterium]